MSPKPPKIDLVDEGDLGMTGEIPDNIKPDMIREIPKQDDETHFSVNVKTNGVIPTGITITAKGTF